MDIAVLMGLLVGALGLALYAMREETGKDGARARYGVATLVIALVISALFVADAVLIMTGVEHIAAWRVSRHYIRGVVGAICMLALVPALVNALVNLRKQPPA